MEETFELLGYLYCSQHLLHLTKCACLDMTIIIINEKENNEFEII